jgi:hypothetical protein
MVERLPFHKIVIVGGGSAGWMAAAYLRRRMPLNVAISLVESPDIPTIGVGEGTLPSFRAFVGELGLDARDWMKRCEATFKLGVRFDNWWNKDRSWWHPFFFHHPSHGERALVDAWLHHHACGDPQLRRPETLRAYSLSWKLARTNRCPISAGNGGATDEWISDHGFHLDATLWAEYLRKSVAVPRGVEHVRGQVTNVIKNPSGWIEALALDGDRSIAGDFFIDCTGFARRLIREVSPARFLPFGQELLCDRAVALRVPYRHPEREMRPYTLATALSSGWVWQIGLFHRLGAGYVYSSSFLSEEEAESELRNFLGEERVKDLTANRIRFTSGRLEEPWVGNCVALGLSEGFVEPLEATGLAVIQHRLREIARILSAAPRFSQHETSEYNREANYIFDEIKQFLVCHYCFSRRTDSTFWCEVRKRRPAVVEVEWRKAGHPGGDLAGRRVFFPQSWICLATGLRALPQLLVKTPVGSLLGRDEMETVRSTLEELSRAFLPQKRYLSSLRSA